MYLKQLEINNFKSILHTKLDFTNGINVIFGENGTGKSNLVKSILKILGPYYPSQNSIQKEDHFCCDETKPIKIRMIFDDESIEHKILWNKEPIKDKYSLYYGRSYMNANDRESFCPLHIPPNREIRELPASSKWTPIGRILFELNKIIESNLEVHDSYITKMHECVDVLENSEEYSSFKEKIQEYTAEQLGSRGDNIKLKLDIIDQRNILKTLQIFEKTRDMNFNVSLGGQGVQSAITMAALRSYSDVCGGSLFIVVDEPEAYLHPLAQKALCKVFEEIVEKGTQIIITTHSPYFISPSYIDGMYRVWMNSNQETQIKKIDIEELKNKKATRNVPDITIEKVKSRLSRQLTLPVREGLFARTVVICEGETEIMSLNIWAENENIDLAKKGITFVQSDGKFSMIDLAEFYESFNIPVYLIWDSDSNTTSNNINHKKHNKLLLNFSGAIPEDFPSTSISDKYSVFDPDFETKLRDSQYSSCETDVSNELGLVNPKSQKGIRARYVALKYRENNFETPQLIQDLLNKIDNFNNNT